MNYYELANSLKFSAMIAEEMGGRINNVDLIRKAAEAITELIARVETADVAPVVHGEWMRYSRTLWHYCSVCLEDALMSKSTGTEVLSSFCPHCGAKMDLE